MTFRQRVMFYAFGGVNKCVAVRRDRSARLAPRFTCGCLGAVASARRRGRTDVSTKSTTTAQPINRRPVSRSISVFDTSINQSVDRSRCSIRRSTDRSIDLRVRYVDQPISRSINLSIYASEQFSKQRLANLSTSQSSNQVIDQNKI